MIYKNKKQYFLALCFFAASIFANNAIAMDNDQKEEYPLNFLSYDDANRYPMSTGQFRSIRDDLNDSDMIGWTKREKYHGIEEMIDPLLTPALYVILGIESNPSREDVIAGISDWHQRRNEADKEYRKQRRLRKHATKIGRRREAISSRIQKGIQYSIEEGEQERYKIEEFFQQVEESGEFENDEKDEWRIVDELHENLDWDKEFDKEWDDLGLDEFLDEALDDEKKPFSLSVKAAAFRPNSYRS